jgi:hypothetical protein
LCSFGISTTNEDLDPSKVGVLGQWQLIKVGVLGQWQLPKVGVLEQWQLPRVVF